jgi:hypothetical protein
VLSTLSGRWQGVFGLCHDGWRAFIELRADGDASLRGRFVDLGMWGRVHDVVATLDTDDPYRIDLAVLRFNELPQQNFTGYAVDRGHRRFAGSAYWRGEEFGFVARRGPIPLMAGFGDALALVDMPDFPGRYFLHHADGVTEIELSRQGNRLAARYRHGHAGRGGIAQVRAGGPANHHLTLDVPLGSAPIRFEGHMFTRPKNCIAGVIERAGTRMGGYLVRANGVGGGRR